MLIKVIKGEEDTYLRLFDLSL